ncbi:MAG TPA: G1 family glutamic endopeptidase [Streptosporangiaceae bacterium]|nr:G1 family glutamic endopeptidase [Streptosporangiaceae bacterium]
MLRRWCIPLAGLALAGGAVAASAPAAAASHPARPTIHLIRPAMHGTAPMVARGRPSQAVESQNWSGYAAHGKTYKSVSASWVQPTGHCTSSRTFSSFWVGLDGFGSKTVEQTGSEADCAGGHARYFAWYEMFPAFPVNFANPVRPGDHFTGSVTFTGGGHYTLVLKDISRGWSHTIHKTLASGKNASAEVIAEAPSSSSGILPLTNFGTVHFSNASVDGAAISKSHPVKITMANGSGRAKDSVSALSGGKSFSVKWLHST